MILVPLSRLAQPSPIMMTISATAPDIVDVLFVRDGMPSDVQNSKGRLDMTVGDSGAQRSGTIAIVVLTYDRVHLLRQCVENVLARTSSATREIVIWDNGSPDGTADYLTSLGDPRLRIVCHETNIGHNAYPDAVALTTAEYVIELDDDMIDAPDEWDLTLLRAFQAVPRMGFLASGLVNNPLDTAAHLMYNVHDYTPIEDSGVRLLLGPTGGYCAITSRDIYDLVGGFSRERRAFFEEDGTYAAAVERAGYRTATMQDLLMAHAGGPHYSVQAKEKVRYYESYKRRVARKVAVKRLLLRVPGVAPLNRRHGWFKSPEETARSVEVARLFLEGSSAPPPG